ncbi:MAG TPA: hypothetical protein VFZ15_06190, partial [Acidimicrobiia bacterium]|nr:hypothetical protein [Acidimicrobiia bacterium]
MHFIESVDADGITSDIESVEPNPSRLDVVMSILSVLLVGGFFIDLWAHSHGRVDESFFTPWHGMLYAAAGLFGGVLLALALRSRSDGKPFREWLPPGYHLSLLGSGLFLAAGLGDLVWHETFGIEENVDALLSPTHLLLAASGILMVFGPVRSAWAKGPPTAFPRWLPWVASMTMAMAILGAFTEYAHPAIDTWPEATVSLDSDRSDLVLVSVGSRSQTRVHIEGSGQAWMPDFAPDGRIAVTVVADEVGRLVTMNADGSDPRTLYEGESIFHHAAWSPDGSMIAFSTDTDGQVDLFLVPGDGGEPTRLTDDEFFDWGPSWSPDGSSVVFVSDRDGSPGLYLVPSAGGEPTRLTNDPGFEGAPAWSPDGEWIAFETNANGSSDIALIRPDGSEEVDLTADDASDVAPEWSPDGSQIVFASDRGGEFDLYLMAGDGSDVEPVAENPGAQDGWAGSSWSEDGELIATNQSGNTPYWLEPDVRQMLGVAALLIQAMLISGF